MVLAHRFPRSAALAAVLGFLTANGALAGKPAFTLKIDQIIQQRLDEAKIPPSPTAADAEFLRRVYLDITGRIPTHQQTTAFLESKEPGKRVRLIDDLLSRPEYGLHFASVWRDLMVDRSSDQSQVRQNYSWEFVDWLAEGFNQGRGWNDIVTNMLTAAGEAKKNPAATFILANRMNDFPRPEDMVSMTGRLFMGIHLRCAQCHDHPYVDKWKQDDFWGVAAFFGQVRDHGMEANGNSRNPTFLDQPNPDAKKETTYVNRMKRAGLMPPQEAGKIGVPTIADPTEIQRLVAAKFFLADAPAMKASDPYRQRLAAWLTTPENPYFARAMANRLWGHFFAQGIVNPVDDMGPNRTPSHPELLDLLEHEFKANRFDLRHLIRGICNSQAYQRTSKPLPGNADDRKLFSHMAIKQLTPDQTVDSLCIAVARTISKGKVRDQMTQPFFTKEADEDPTEFSHGIPQFLYQMNAGFANGNPSIVGQLTNGKSSEEAVTGLYLAALSRPPKPAELKRMLAYIDESGSPTLAYRDIYWVLLNSAEFILNH